MMWIEYKEKLININSFKTIDISCNNHLTKLINNKVKKSLSAEVFLWIITLDKDTLLEYDNFADYKKAVDYIKIHLKAKDLLNY